MTERAAWAVRALLVLAFAWYVYTTQYAPVRNQPYDEVLTAATIDAFNAGHPFSLAFPTGPGAPPTIRKMTEYYGDYGTHIPLSIVGFIERWIHGPSYRLSSPTARTVIFAFLLLVAATLAAGPVPLAVGVTGVLSLWALIRWGTLGLYDARYWGVSVVAVVLVAYVMTALKPWTRGRVVVLALLAGIAGYGQLLRQEAGPTTNIAGLVLAGAAIVTYVAGRGFRRSDPSSTMRTVAARALAGGLLLLVVNAAVEPAERLMFSRAWGTSYAETPFAVHGSGWPLYLSLGYVSNPFNLGWRDPIGELHARLIDPDIKLDTDPAFQRTLREEYVRIVVSRPWLFLRNVVAKAVRVHELAGHPSGANTGTIITQPMALVVFYWAAPWMMVAALLLLLWRGGPEGVLGWLSAVAVAAAACAGPLLIFPEYIGGLQGATIALVLIVPAAVLSADTFATREVEARQLLRLFLTLAVVAAAAAAVFVGVQAFRYRLLQREITDADPLREVRAREFRYAHTFNDLPVSRQGRLVARLQASDDAAVARVIDEKLGDQELFSPQVIVRTQTQIHVFVWMGRGFVPPPRLFQGSTHVSLLICGSCPPSATINDIQYPRGGTMINDLEWQGRYRMFTVQNDAALKSVPFLRVTAERVTALDTTLPTWIVPEQIASARLSFPETGR